MRFDGAEIVQGRDAAGHNHRNRHGLGERRRGGHIGPAQQTIAVKEPGLVKAACKQWPGQVAVGIDARDGIVAVDGWTKQSTVRALDLALRFEDAGVAAIIYTDIDRDGAMGGVNIDATVTLAQHLTTPVIASGGVSSLDDLRELLPAEEHGIVGAIVGRALYDGRVTVPDAIRVLKGE